MIFIFNPELLSNSIAIDSSLISLASSSLIKFNSNKSKMDIGSARSALSTYLNNTLTNVHSFIIGILTLSIMIFILNPELLLNSIAICISLLLKL